MGIATVIHREPDAKPEEGSDDGLKAATKDLMEAFKNDDLVRGMEALRSAFMILDSQPHEEYDHSEEESE
jgi:hypothetical protein